MRKLRWFVLAVGLVGLVLLPAAGAQAVPTHLHCITTPNGQVHAIAQGVTFTADAQGQHDTAFHNLHAHVHQGAFATNPIPISADVTQPFDCPPSP